jgi:hypothetical protein
MGVLNETAFTIGISPVIPDARSSHPGSEVQKLWSSHTALSVAIIIMKGRSLAMGRVYFGYAANSNVDAMALRCPAARRIGTGILRGAQAGVSCRSGY